MSTLDVISLTAIIAAMLATYKSGKLTPAGTITGGLVAFIIYIGSGLTGIVMLGAFFILSVWATSHKKNEKRKLSTGQQHSEKRTAGQVVANGGVAALLGLAAHLMPHQSALLVILMTAALASATADTLSSELGTVYGRRFYNIITLKPGEKGRDGVISLEGTLAGIIGSAIIAVTYSIIFRWNLTCLFIIIAGTIGNLSDSVLGATLERKGHLNNNAVNFLNTAIAAVSCWVMIIL
ncbi:DUF92 domain-containing protein [Mucilaginibacter glaciei]|uniref:DUF92 domain-containing protein n=1 Tax=Mucilaginibacter glaciei TaxID=2772109 RepID=A0A926S0M4_9SPHI|nr:DUF92 domain-containing protein [Mucilaginibacter glaciei]MBD1392153.1 DUF92 domain-containing protein [Mucilaginibacter glaciei]